MKHSQPVFAAIIILSLFIVVGYTACVNEKCSKINCINGGGCNKGICICPDGYEGTYCEIKTDLCKKVICQNNGTCTDGKCECLLGYEGTYCEQLTRDKMTGQYMGTSDCSSGWSTTAVAITAGQNERTLILNGGWFSNQTATITSKNTFAFAFSIPYYEFIGTGTLTNGGVTITYTITGGVSGPSGNPATITCTFVGKK